MKIRVRGFEWHLGKSITFNQFNEFLSGLSGNELSNFVIAMCQERGFWVGVLLTIKNIKAFCQMQKDKRDFTISAKELEEGTSIVDFNFFIVHPKTGKGLYQHYHNSASPNTFCSFCKKQYNFLRENLIKEETKKRGGTGELSTFEISKIRSKFSGKFTYSTLLKQDAFEKYVEELKQITYFGYEYSTIAPEKSQSMSAIERLADRQSYRLYFSPPTNKLAQFRVAKIKKTIIDMASSNILKRAKIKGVDPDDNEAVYKLLNDYESFAEYDYEDIIKTVNIDSTQLINSVKSAAMVKTLLNLAVNNKQIKAILEEETR